MKSKTGCFILIFCFFLFGMYRISQAEECALEQLLNLFEKKALVTPEEVKIIRETMARDRERLLKKERGIEDKRRALIRWEEELKGRENSLQIKERAVSDTEEAPPDKVLQAEKSMAGDNTTTFQEASSQGQTVFSLQAMYQNGFCLSTAGEDTFSLCIGGLLQADYRYYDYDGQDPDKNKFDLRRVRLLLKGNITNRFGYKFEYEFQGAGSRNLLDAYVDAHISPYASIRVGQFKEPFSLEQYTKDKNLFFAERSMGYYLTPGRDVGLMVHGSFWDDRINYGIGIFNGDGKDDTTGGDVDDPEWTGRLVVAPFKNGRKSLWENLQVGGSFSYARIDRNNVSIHVKTAGLTTFFDVASSAKFNIIREVDHRNRYGAELGWAYGPLALMGEYTRVKYKDITTSTDQFSTDLENYYIALLWMITGEKPSFKNGVFQPIRPRTSIWEGGWGGLGLALRYNYFKAERSVYDFLIFEGNSVCEAKAYTIALNWYLNSWARLILDATRTRFDRPLLIARDSLHGTSIYRDREDIFTARFQLGF